MELNSNKRQSIGREKALELYNSGWWKDRTATDIVMFQFFTDELCMPFSDFHSAMEDHLGRPLWTHEFGFWDTLCKEVLREKPAPSFEEIIDLIPEAKRIIITL